LRIVCISDTHELHRELSVPDGDLLIHAGDFTVFSEQPSKYREFDQWLGGLPHLHKVVVPGNHDFLLEEPRERAVIKNATLLVDSGVEVAGLRIWGSPVTPLYGGAFGMSNATDRKRHWAQVPVGTDILVTHGPPFGILDHPAGTQRKEGCPELLEAVLRVKPRLHVFGHIHYGYGTQPTDTTLFVNAAVFTADDLKKPIVLELSKL
jgi:Icc-related predicted phosphoesterase